MATYSLAVFGGHYSITGLDLQPDTHCSTAMTRTNSPKWGVFFAQNLNLSTWDISMLVNELASHSVSLAAGRQLFRQLVCRAARGSRSAGTRPGILTVVLEATMRDPQAKTPAPG
jgi:hypothetical protein